MLAFGVFYSRCAGRVGHFVGKQYYYVQIAKLVPDAALLPIEDLEADFQVSGRINIVLPQTVHSAD
jgi:hypothetical protein